jgi:hypothetical protein
MAATPRLVAAIVIPVLAFAVGYLLGAGPNQGTGNNQEVLANQRELMRLLREAQEFTPTEARPTSPRLAGDPNPRANASGNGFRLPSLDPWMERIEEAVKRLEDAAERGSRIAPPSSTDTLRRASRLDLPRNDAELKKFIREYEAAENADYDDDRSYDRIWDTLYSKYLYQSMDQMLDRFGRPDDISVSAGSSSWEYYYERSLPSGLTEDWGVSLEFADGVLVDFHGYWNRIE